MPTSLPNLRWSALLLVLFVLVAPATSRAQGCNLIAGTTYTYQDIRQEIACRAYSSGCIPELRKISTDDLVKKLVEYRNCLDQKQRGDIKDLAKVNEREALEKYLGGRTDEPALIKAEEIENSELEFAIIRSTAMVIPKDTSYGRREMRYQSKVDALKKKFEDHGYRGKECMFSADEGVFSKGTRSGIIWTSNQIVTAGHGLRKGDTVFVVVQSWRSNWWFGERKAYWQTRTGVVSKVSWGSAFDADLALIDLFNRDLRNLLVADTEHTSVPSSGSRLVYSGHPWGLPIVADLNGAYKDYPAEYWENSPYFFAGLYVGQGSSGAPVFEEITSNGNPKDTTYKLVGMVVGGGGVTDFYFDDSTKKFDWITYNDANALSTRVLKIGAIKEWVDGKQTDTKGEEKGQKTILTSPYILGPDNYRAYFGGNQLILKSNSGKARDTVFTFTDSIPLLVTLKGCSLYVEEDRCLDDVYVGSIQQLAIHQEDWPTDIMIPPTDYLEFRCNFQSKDVPSIGLPTDVSYSVLDGIGTADIVDILPNKDHVMRKVWLCDQQPLEFSLVPQPGFSQGKSKYVIGIRSIMPYVKIFTRTSER